MEKEKKQVICPHCGNVLKSYELYFNLQTINFVERDLQIVFNCSKCTKIITISTDIENLIVIPYPL